MADFDEVTLSLNEEKYGGVSPATSENLLDNESKLDYPIQYYLNDVSNTDPDGSIKAKKLSEIVKSNEYKGAVSTLRDPRLYPQYSVDTPYLLQKEKEQKQIIFDSSSGWNRFWKNKELADLSLEKSSLIYKQNKAELEGDINLAYSYQKGIEDLDYQIFKYSQPQDDFIGNFSSFAASSLRNLPELSAVGVGTALASSFLSGGWSVLAGIASGLIKAGITYSDTKPIEAGSFIQELEQEYPEMSQEERFAFAEKIGTINAVIEAGFEPFVGTGAGVTKILSKGISSFAKKFIKQQGVEAIKKMTKETLVRFFLGQVVDATGEVIQEELQQKVGEAVTRGIEKGETSSTLNFTDNLIEAIQHPENLSADARLAFNTFFSSLIMTSATSGAVNSVSLFKSAANLQAVDKASKYFNRKAKYSTASERATTKHNQEVGSCPKNVYIDSSTLGDIEKESLSKSNNEVLRVIEEIKNRGKLDNSSGFTTLDFADAEELLPQLAEEDQVLFQKVMGNITFDKESFSKAQFKQTLEGIFEASSEIKKAAEDSESVFNKVKDSLLAKKGYSKEQALYDASMAQLVWNSAKTFEGEESKTAKNISFEVTSDEESFFSKFKKKLVRKDNELIAGAFNIKDNDAMILLTKASNPTTFAHEFFHLTTEVALRSFNSGEMTDFWKKNFNALATFVGAEQDKNGKINFTEKQKELLADSWLKYLKEGKAPNNSLSTIFQKFVDFFKDLFRIWRKEGKRLNNEVREAFDALVLTEEGLDRARMDKNINFLSSKNQKNYSPEFMENYRKTLSSISRVARTKTLTAIAELAKKMNEKENKAMFAELEKVAQEQLQGKPSYEIANRLETNGVYVDSDVEGVQITNKNFLAKDSEYGESLSMVAMDYGFAENIKQFADYINSLKTTKQQINEAATDMFKEYLLNKYPDLQEINPNLSLSSQKLIEKLAYEYVFLKGLPEEQFKQILNRWYNVAQEQLDNSQIKELNAKKYEKIEKNQLTKARFEKDEKKLADILQNQAITNIIIQECLNFSRKHKKLMKILDSVKTQKAVERTRTRMFAKDIDLIQSVFSTFGFISPSKIRIDMPTELKLQEFIDQADEQYSFSDIITDEDVMVLSQKQDITKRGEIKYSDYKVLLNAVELIKADSSNRFKLEKAMDKEEILEDISSIKVDEKTRERISGQITSSLIKSTISIPVFLGKLLPERLYIKYVAPFLNSISKKNIRINEFKTAYADIFRGKSAELKKLVDVDLGGGQKQWTMEKVLSAYLNLNNIDSLLRSLIKEYGVNLSQSDIISIFDNLSDEDFKFVTETSKQVWSLMDSQKEALREVGLKVSNFLMDFQKLNTFTIRGEDVVAGYYPSYNFNASQYKPLGFNNVIQGFLISSQKDKVAPHDGLRLDLSVIQNWLYQTAYEIEVAPYYNQVWRLFNNNSFGRAVSPQIQKILKNWASSANAPLISSKCLAFFDTIASQRILGFRFLRRFFGQGAGFVSAIPEVGLNYIIPEVIKSLNPNRMIHSISEGMQLSEYMQDRGGNDVRGFFDTGLSGAERFEKFKNFIMVGNTAGDFFASRIVWNAAFRKAMDSGKTEAEAKLIADNVVRTTQGDSSKLMSPELVQGNLRFFNKFISYFTSVYSHLMTNVWFRDYKGAANNLIYAVIISSAVGSTLQSLAEIPFMDDDEERKLRKRGIRTVPQFLADEVSKDLVRSAGASVMPYFGVGEGVFDFFINGERHFKTLPVISAMDDFVIGATSILRAIATADLDELEVKSLLRTLTLPDRLVKIITNK